MSETGRERSAMLRWSGIVLTLLASTAFLVSFFLPAAICISAVPGGALRAQSGWQTFVESFQVPARGICYQANFLLALCWLSPLPNGLMLLGLLVNLKFKSASPLFGVLLLISATTTAWVCWQIYEGLDVGFFVWIGSILAMALASFVTTVGEFAEDNVEHERLLEELKDLSKVE